MPFVCGMPFSQMTREIRRGAADPLFEIFEEAARMKSQWARIHATLKATDSRQD
jgi:hypothetical protein